MGGCFSKTENLEPPREQIIKPTVVPIVDGGFSGTNKTDASKLDFVTRWKDDICAICARFYFFL
jgi:hypothetical protein